MFFETFVVGVWVVVSEVDAAAFFAGQGGLRDEEADGEHILKLPALGVIKLLVHYVALPEAYLLDGLLEVVCFSGDSDVSPHNGPKRISHVGGIETGAVGMGDFVFYYGLGGAGCFFAYGGLSCDSAEDKTFEKRVAA